MNPDLSIIIISYNTRALTEQCIITIFKSLEQSLSLKAEIIVIDNNSTDGSVEMLKNYQKKVHVIESKENLGYAQGNNLAAKEAKGECILFLNSDIEALDDAVPKLFDFFTQKSEFQFAGAKLLNSDKTVQHSCGRFYTLIMAFASLFLQADSWGLTRFSPKKAQQVDWVSGACFITKKEYFEKLGGFDESIFMYWDEVDFFYRAKLQNMKVGFFPEAVFIHHEGASSKDKSAIIEKVFSGYMFFYKKHFQFQSHIISYMLQLKALSAIIIGRLTHNTEVVKNYTHAYETLKKN